MAKKKTPPPAAKKPAGKAAPKKSGCKCHLKDKDKDGY